ncbi:hypothetical protein B0H16DRAFT_1464711 [Mycena metata]|uniref:Uncharacterized protein n=1 Tax=Mycena metata TaxID=1033252 RepID=A0AAD7IDS7_9AGAR|nr:hypothetical protein B0H16DRAFT_1464711 [Mycena metata]
MPTMRCGTWSAYPSGQHIVISGCRECANLLTAPAITSLPKLLLSSNQVSGGWKLRSMMQQGQKGYSEHAVKRKMSIGKQVSRVPQKAGGVHTRLGGSRTHVFFRNHPNEHRSHKVKTIDRDLRGLYWAILRRLGGPQRREDGSARLFEEKM